MNAVGPSRALRPSRATGLALALGLTLAGCVPGPPGPPAEVGVLLPGEAAGSRWENADELVLDNELTGLDRALRPTIEFAEDAAEATTQATEMIDAGAKVLVYAAADPDVDAAIVGVTRGRGVPTVGYDWTGTGVRADVAVATDVVALGGLHGRGIVRGIRARTGATVIELTAGPTPAATADLERGLDDVLGPRYASNTYRRLARERVDPTGANTAVVLNRLLDANGGQVDGVVAANDKVARAALDVLRRRGLIGRTVVTGADADPAALRAMLLGEQFSTAYTPPPAQAAVAARLARALAAGDRAAVDATTSPGTEGRRVARVAPAAVYLSTINEVFTGGLADSDEVCAGGLELRCNQLSIP